MSRKILIMALLWTSGAWAGAKQHVMGVDTSGGGNAVVCRDSQGVIQSAEVLDLFEAKWLWNLNVVPVKDTPVNVLNGFVTQLVQLNPDEFYIQVDMIAKQVVAAMQILPPNMDLVPIDDSFPVLIPKGCKIEQLAAYLPTGKLLVDGEIWSHLDDTGRAALLTHETIYRYMRDHGATNSTRSRSLVGHLMAHFPFEPAMPNSVVNGYQCSDNGAHFIFYVDIGWGPKQKTVPVYFTRESDQPVISRTSIMLEPSIFRPNWTGSVARYVDSKYEYGLDLVWNRHGKGDFQMEVADIFGTGGYANTMIHCSRICNVKPASLCDR